MFAAGEDSAAAKEAARIDGRALRVVRCRTSSCERNGVDPEELAPVIAALGAGDLGGAIDATTPEIAETLSIAGTPEECVEKIKREIEPAGVNHMILAITDAALVKTFMGREVEGVPGRQHPAAAGPRSDHACVRIAPRGDSAGLRSSAGVVTTPDQGLFGRSVWMGDTRGMP